MIYDLPPGQSIMVHPGHIGMFEESVNFEITMIKGIRNALFGADGLFMGVLTGPGRIWLQSMTVPNLAHAVAPYLQQESSGGSSVTGGIAGGIIGNILRNE